MKRLLILLLFALALLYLFFGLNIFRVILYMYRDDVLSNPMYTKAIVEKVIPSSAAEKVGLKVNDEIYQLNGLSTTIGIRLASDSIHTLRVKRNGRNVDFNLESNSFERHDKEIFGIQYNLVPLDLTAFDLSKEHMGYLMSKSSIRNLWPMIGLGVLHLILVSILTRNYKLKARQGKYSGLLFVTGSIVILEILLSLIQGITILHLLSMLLLISVGIVSKSQTIK